MPKRGEKVAPRDKRKWRVPKEGTKSRRIYDLLEAGLSLSEIHGEFPTSKYNTLAVLVWKIKHPTKGNYYSRRKKK